MVRPGAGALGDSFGVASALCSGADTAVFCCVVDTAIFSSGVGADGGTGSLGCLAPAVVSGFGFSTLTMGVGFVTGLFSTALAFLFIVAGVTAMACARTPVNEVKEVALWERLLCELRRPVADAASTFTSSAFDRFAFILVLPL
jgi:hypothetical protein